MTCTRCGCPRASGLQVGDVLYGYCQGYFGRDSYGEKTVLAIGPDWVVVSENVWSIHHDELERVLHVYDGDPHDLLEFTEKPDEDDSDD